MNGYRFHLTCPDCGGVLDDREDTSRVLSPTRTTAEAWCAVCMVRYSVSVTVSVLDVLNIGDWRQRARERAGESCVDDGRKVFA